MFLYHKGAIYAQAGHVATAKTALYQALSLNPNFHPLEAPAAVKLINELGTTLVGAGMQAKPSSISANSN